MPATPRALPPELFWRTLGGRSFCTLATTAPATGQPHVVGVLYAVVDRHLWIHTARHSKKARNIAGNERVAVCVPVRKYPVGPPFCLQFGGDASLYAVDDPAVVALLDGGRLKRITSHGELEDPDSCFIRLAPHRKAFTYGIGVSVLTLLRDPLHAMGTVDLG